MGGVTDTADLGAALAPADVEALVERADLWHDVVGQGRAVAALQAAATRPVHAYLLVGPAGSGKRAAARAFAGALLAIDAAGRGADVERAIELSLDESHPDLHVFEPEGASLTMGDAEDIVTAASRSPVEGRRKVLVLEEFHKVQQAGPALLKTIEEPPASTVFVILAEEVPNELVAIASRAVRIDLGPVPQDAVTDRLVAEGIDREVAATTAAAAGGDLHRARLLARDPSLVVRRDSWASIPHRVDRTGHTAAALVDEVVAHIDAAQGALDERHEAERLALEEQIEAYGMRTTPLKDLEKKHKREVRRHRNAEIRFGLAVLAGEYRDRLATAGDPTPHLAALRAVQEAAEALVRNPNETLLLQALVGNLDPL
jgi:DNA polymerase-3 subunit delta'